MRASPIALLTLVLLAACSQAPVQPAPAQSAPVAAAPPAATTRPPPAPAIAPPPQVQAPASAAPPQPQEVPVDKYHREVLIHTNQGDIVVQLDAVHAPVTAKHFLTYANEH